jgi:hypothetical protein
MESDKMKSKLCFEIESGEMTCAIVPGKFCRYMSWSMNGKTRCFFFGELEEEDEWTLRHQYCLNSTALIIPHKDDI